MAYRFTDTDKWSDTWFLDLRPLSKLMFLYLCDQCDIAGFCEINIRKMQFDLSTNRQEVEKSLEDLRAKIIYSTDGRFIFIRNFIKHQRNYPLNPKNGAHIAILKKLEENLQLFDFDAVNNFFLGGSMGAKCPLGIGNGKGIGKEDKGGLGEKETSEPENKSFILFQNWLSDKCPFVSQMKVQMTEKEFNTLKSKYSSSEIQDVIESMDNTTGIGKKYTNVYRTANNWLKIRKNGSKTA